MNKMRYDHMCLTPLREIDKIQTENIYGSRGSIMDVESVRRFEQFTTITVNARCESGNWEMGLWEVSVLAF